MRPSASCVTVLSVMPAVSGMSPADTKPASSVKRSRVVTGVPPASTPPMISTLASGIRTAW
jgi:hypothetical protein